MRKTGQSSIFCIALLMTAPLQADDWKHEVAPYLWGAAMDGTSRVGGVTAEIDASFSDILDNLEMGFMGMYRASRDDFSVIVDAVYMGLGTVERGPGGQLKADIDLDQVALEVDAGYQVVERLTVFGGLRYVDLSAKIRVTGPLGNVESGDGDKNWVDPVIGALYTIPYSNTWSTTLRADIGGFGVSSDFAWQGIATLRWQASDRVGVVGAYRYMYMDYEDGQGQDFFIHALTANSVRPARRAIRVADMRHKQAHLDGDPFTG